MSPSAVPHSTASDHFKDDLNLSILGLGVAYPDIKNGPEALDIIARRHYPESTALNKVLSINKFTGIDTRSTIATVDHPAINRPEPPSIAELDNIFRQEGVRLSVTACRKAIKEWGGSIEEITHVVSTTCSNSANPGFDHYVCKQLGIRSNVEKVLLHGIGCSGGLAAIRTASNLALGLSFRHKPARILVLACEITSMMVRSELDSIHKKQEVRIGVCLFGDCASASILSNGVGVPPSTEPIYQLLGWKHDVIEDTDQDLGFDVDPHGWKVILTPRVPTLAAASVQPAFQDLLNSLPRYHKQTLPTTAADFDWALHPGGLTVITGVEAAMNLTPEHLRASYGIYMENGNSSSATIMSVMDRLRRDEGGRENVVACAFGPGIIIEMMIMKRPSLAPANLPTEDLD
ncbi:hypothetical protein MMC11_005658 [Xylographa trunciseda]|nr:hypothetical protein [Xylographa trunciseda]